MAYLTYLPCQFATTLCFILLCFWITSSLLIAGITCLFIVGDACFIRVGVVNFRLLFIVNWFQYVGVVEKSSVDTSSITVTRLICTGNRRLIIRLLIDVLRSWFKLRLFLRAIDSNGSYSVLIVFISGLRNSFGSFLISLFTLLFPSFCTLFGLLFSCTILMSTSSLLYLSVVTRFTIGANFFGPTLGPIWIFGLLDWSYNRHGLFGNGCGP